MKNKHGRLVFFVLLTVLFSLIFGTVDLLATSWTDSNLLSGARIIRPVHFRELRRAVYNKLRMCNLPVPSFSDATLVPKVTPIRKVHVDELRQAIGEIYQKPPTRSLPTFTDSNIVAGETQIRAVHIQELRQAIDDASCCGDGVCNHPTEDLANCGVDCGACAYSSWEVVGCGQGGCEANEVFRRKTAPPVGEGGTQCPEIDECVISNDTCCNYGAWTDFDCSGECAVNKAKRQQRLSVVTGCEPEFRCLADKSCCDYLDWRSQCGYPGKYPASTKLEVREPQNSDCEPEFRNIEPNDETTCCQYSTTSMMCGGTADGNGDGTPEDYPDSEKIEILEDQANSDCPRKVVVTPEAEECCHYGASEIKCGGTYKVNGASQTYPGTTYLEIEQPTNPSCNVHVLLELPGNQSDYCCQYQGFQGSCGFGSYPVYDWIEYNLPTRNASDPLCPTVYRNHIPFAESCCQYTVTSACGDGVSHPVTDLVTTKTPIYPECSVIVDVEPGGCCGYPADWTSQCGFPGYYDDTVHLEVKVPANTALCDPIFRNVSPPFDWACCDYGAEQIQCGGTVNGITYPDTTLISGMKVPANPNCPTIYFEMTEFAPVCCDYSDVSQCGGVVNGITYSPRDLIRSRFPGPGKEACPVLTDQVVADGCCNYSPQQKLCGYGGNPVDTSADVSISGNPICEDQITNVIASDPFCCSYGPYSAPRCGYPSYYPNSTRLEVSEVGNPLPGCVPQFQNVVPNDEGCCEYGPPNSYCGGTNATDWVTERVSAQGCASIVNSEPNHQNCCNYGTPQTGCGDGVSYPRSSAVTKQVPQSNPNCPEKIVGTPAFSESCCLYGSSIFTCGYVGPGIECSGGACNFTDNYYVGRQEPGIVDAQCPVKIINYSPPRNRNAPACCAYQPWQTYCGYPPGTFTLFPSTTKVDIQQAPTSPNCRVYSQNVFPNDPSCCEYSAYVGQCGYPSGTFATYPQTTWLEYSVSAKGCSTLFRNVAPYADACCGYLTGNIENLGCGASDAGTSCTYDKQLIRKTPTNNNCPVVRECQAVESCLHCTEGTLSCPNDINGCPQHRTCDAGLWSACKPSYPVCVPETVLDCPVDANGFIGHKKCNSCGTAYSECYCTPQEVQSCTTAQGCPGIATCTGSTWGSFSCAQNNPLCTPGDRQPCTLASGLSGAETCNTCGTAWGACQCFGNLPCLLDGGHSGVRECDAGTGQYNDCRCLAGTTIPCTTNHGCTSGVISCNESSGKYNGNCELPASRECNPGDTASCLFLQFLPGIKTCDICGTWGWCGPAPIQ